MVASDGRGSTVARQIGCAREGDPEHHRFSGMLVGDAHDWPVDLQVIATEGDVHVLAFPQGGGKVRIYLGFPKQEPARVAGPEGPKRFLESWRIACVPHSDVIAGATPISPCIAYANADAWVDHSRARGRRPDRRPRPGRNDPTIGQGLSVTHRDVRLVRDAMLGEATWREATFTDYARERKERMARLRMAARVTSLRVAAFGPEGRALRREIHERMQARARAGGIARCRFRGPRCPSGGGLQRGLRLGGGGAPGLVGPFPDQPRPSGPSP